MMPTHHNTSIHVLIGIFCLFMLLSCGQGEEQGGKQEDASESAAHKLADTKTKLDEALKKVESLTMENKSLIDKQERERFRAVETEKNVQKVQHLRVENNRLKEQVAKLESELKHTQAIVKTLRSRLDGKSPPKNPLFKVGDCVQWFWGLYQRKKVVQGRVKFEKNGIYMIVCTNSEVPYLWAVGENYEVAESELRACK